MFLSFRFKRRLPSASRLTKAASFEHRAQQLLDDLETALQASNLETSGEVELTPGGSAQIRLRTLPGDKLNQSGGGRLRDRVKEYLQ